MYCIRTKSSFVNNREITHVIIIIMMMLLFQSSMLTCDKISRAHELHKVCQSYPEPVLSAAFESMKANGVVSNTKLVSATVVAL